MDAGVVRVLEESVNHVPEHDARATLAPRELVVALVLGFFRDGDTKSLANIRLAVIDLVQKKIARSSLWNRLAAKRLGVYLSVLITTLLAKAMAPLGIAADLLGRLGVRRVFLLDSTQSSLPDSAASDFPGSRTNSSPAAVKWHALWDLFTGAVAWHRITEGSSNDANSFPPVRMLRGALIIFDLGYWDFDLFAKLIAGGVFFLSRVKSSAVVTIREVVTGLPRQDLVGRSLASVKHGKRNVVEVIGSFGAQGTIFTARVIGFWNKGTNQFHWYTTNLRVPAKVIYPLYRLRWQIELSFKACKSTLRLADFTTANPRIIRNLILANIAAVMLAQPLARSVATEAEPEQQAAVSVQRIAKVVVNVARELAHCLISGTASARRALIDKMQLFAAELFDPNYKRRQTSLARVRQLLESTC